MAIYYLIEMRNISNTLEYIYNGRVSLDDDIVKKLVFVCNDDIGAIFQDPITKKLYVQVLNDSLVANMFI